MPAKKDAKKEFLDKFTEEMISHVGESKKKRQKENSEEIRRKKEIEVEKLKMKFAKYGEKQEVKKEEKKPEQKPVSMPIKQVVKPVQAPAPKPQPAQIQKPAPVPTPAAPPSQPAAPKPPIPQKKPEMPLIKVPMPPKMPPVAPGEINFGKIAFLVRDPLIMYIECPGENKNVIIRKAGGVATKTQITLSKVEIQGIIKSFAEKARIPVIEGMLKARVVNLEMSAVVSEVASPSFIIKKILLPPEKQPSRLQGPMTPMPAGMPKPGLPMPPVNRPFVNPRAMPPAAQAIQPAQAKPGENKEGTGFFNKKFKIGK